MRSKETCAKALLLQYLVKKKRLRPSHTVIDELKLNSSPIRSDIAIAKQRLLECFEVKTGQDNLKRLQNQIHQSHIYYDKVTIFAHIRFLPHLEKYKYSKTGIIVYTDDQTVHEIQKSIQSEPVKEKSIEMIPLSELHKLLRDHNIALKSEVTKKELSKLAYCLPLKAIRDRAVSNIKQRHAISNSLFWRSIQKNSIRSLHVELLNTNRINRLSKKRLQRAIDDWSSWNQSDQSSSVLEIMSEGSS